MPKVTSKAQAKFFGAVKSGKIKIKGLSKKEAGIRLKGVKAKGLPRKVKKK